MALGDSSGGREEGGGPSNGSRDPGGSREPNQGPSGASSGPGQSGSSAQNNQTLRDFLQANREALENEEMFAVVPLKTCPHLESITPVPDNGIDATVPCQPCGDKSENWICLSCYQVRCGRFVNEHMLMHSLDTGHPLTLSFSDLSVWCYPCEAYIDNQALFAAKNALHQNKFGSSLVWSYGSATDQSQPT